MVELGHIALEAEISSLCNLDAWLSYDWLEENLVLGVLGIGPAGFGLALAAPHLYCPPDIDYSLHTES